VNKNEIKNESIEPLIQALRDHRDGLRAFAVRRLVAMGEAAVPALIQALKYPDEQVQEAVGVALVTIGPRALVQLIRAMNHDDSNIRWGACWVLSSMPPEVRQMLPKVKLPGDKKAMDSAAIAAAITAAASGSGLHHGVWSDSWLSKVRETLARNRVADVLDIAAHLLPSKS
jgi:HEAT repeat protein